MSTENRLRYDTVLWDFHGTFTSQKGRLAHAINEAYREVLGKTLDKDTFLTVLNRPQNVSVQDALANKLNGDLSNEKKAELLQVYREKSDTLYVPKHRHLIRALHEMGVRMAIVTNGNEAQVTQSIESWDLLKELIAIYGKGVGSKLQHMPRKPSGNVIEFVLEDLRRQGHPVRRDNTLMIGDYKDDIGAGNNAGVHTAFIVTGPNQCPTDYPMRPTYALLDTPHISPVSPWYNEGNTFHMRDLPKIIKGDI